MKHSHIAQTIDYGTNFRKIRTRILILLCILLVNFWGGLAFYLARTKAHTLQTANVHAVNMARAFEEHVRRTVGAIDQVLFNGREQYRRSPETFDVAQILANATSLQDISFQVSAIDREGMLFASNMGAAAERLDLSDREHFKAHSTTDRDELFISKLIVGRISGKQSIQFTRKLLGPKGDMAGVLVLSVDPAYFSDYYSSIEIGKQGLVSLMGLDGFVRARSSAVPGIAEKPIGGERLARDIAVSGHSGAFEDHSCMDGVLRIVSFRKVKGHPLVVLVGLALSDVLAAYSSQLAWVLPFGLVFTGVQGGFGWVLLARFSQDTTTLREKENHIFYIAYHDALTGLANRQLFLDRLEHGLSLAKREGRGLAIMFVDLDKFKWVNDSYGHQVGDVLLQAVAEKLAKAVRSADTVARMGGDEFVILLENVDTEEQVRVVAGKIGFQLSGVFIKDSQEGVTASLGVSMFPRDGVDADALLRRADKAMYAAKKAGGNAARIFDLSMDSCGLGGPQGGARQAPPEGVSDRP